MRALTVRPGQAGSAAVTEVPEPKAAPGELVVDALAVGVCGTDREIVAAEYGEAPPGQQDLVIGHESLGRVREVPADSRFQPGDLVVGVVRRPDPVPCGACARGEFDMCRNERYTERGIKGLNGFASERWLLDEAYAVKLPGDLESVGVLVEPTSVVAKAWEQIQRIGQRAWFAPSTVLVTGAGPIGLLAALLAVQRGLRVHVFDRATGGPKPELVAALGATYHSQDLASVCAQLQPDIVIEATGASAVIAETFTATGPYGVVCLTGVSSPGQTVRFDAAAANREIVLENDAIVGSVNANLRHYEEAVEALRQADNAWLDGLITRRLPLSRFAEALSPQENDVKTIITF